MKVEETAVTKHALAKVLAIAIVALPVTACGSTSSTSSSTAANDASGRSSLGAAHRASGEPIQVAMISQETGPNAIPDEREAAQVAVKYVNTYLGGINGRPLKLAFCATDGSPEASSSCANQLLARHPVAFVGNLDQGTSGSGPIIERAGVPLFGTAAITPDAAGATNSYALGLVGLNDLAGWVKYAVTGLKAKRINFMVIQLPGASINNTAHGHGHVVLRRRGLRRRSRCDRRRDQPRAVRSDHETAQHCRPHDPARIRRLLRGPQGSRRGRLGGERRALRVVVSQPLRHGRPAGRHLQIGVGPARRLERVPQ
jgi:hypothetical protein